MLIFHFAVWLNIFISIISCFWNFQYILHIRSCHLWTEIILLLPFHLDAFYSYFVPNDLARTCNIMIIRTGENKHHCLVPGFWRKISLSLKYDVNCEFFIHGFYHLKEGEMGLINESNIYCTYFIFQIRVCNHSKMFIVCLL